MRYYVNPKNMSKEEFLLREGKQIFISKGLIVNLNDFWVSNVPKDHLPVVWVDNGSFSAAGICYSKEELALFLTSEDKRPKMLFIVPIDQLREVSNIGDYLDTLK